MKQKRSRIKLPLKQYKALCFDVLDRDGWKCRVPGCKARQDLHAHHIVFRSDGGDDADYNLITLCGRCHEAIHNRHLIILSLLANARSLDKPVGTEPIDANGAVKWFFVSGWTPGKT